MEVLKFEVPDVGFGCFAPWEFPPSDEFVCQVGVYGEIGSQYSTCFSVDFFSFVQFVVVIQPACRFF